MVDRAPPLRILVVDDHAVVREGLVAVLSSRQGLLVCGQAGDGEAAVTSYDDLRPDVTLMDLQMPRLDGVGAIEAIRSTHPEACIIVLTTFDTDEDIERALRAGARGFLLKDSTVDEVADAIREVHAGHLRIAPAIASKLALQATQVRLTKRELAVLRLLAEGKTNKEIGAALSIAETTVKLHVKGLFEKLNVTNRMEAIAAAARRGLVRMR